VGGYNFFDTSQQTLSPPFSPDVNQTSLRVRRGGGASHYGMHEPVPGLRNILLLAALFALALLAYAPSAAALWRFWIHNEYLGGHGPLVAAMSLWLVWRSRAALERAPVQASRWGFVGLFLCTLAWVIFWRAAIQELHMLLLPLILFFAVLAAFGSAVARLLAFPLGFLYFADPPWHLLTGPLQGLTLYAAAYIAPLLGMPTQIEGNLLHLPGGVTFEVTPFCSGVNFLLIGLALAALIGELEQASLRRRAALMVSMALIAVVSNWARVLAIMVAGYTSGMRNVLVASGHLTFGWVLFALVMFGFTWVVTRRGLPTHDAERSLAPGTARPGALRGLVGAAGLLIAMPILARAVPAALDPRDAALALRLPTSPAGWHGPLAASDRLWKPDFIGAHSEWHVAYQDSAGGTVEILVIGYPAQDQGRKLVSEVNSLLGDGDLTAVGAASATRGELPHIETVASDAKGRRFVLWSVYDIGGRKFVTPLFSQLWYGLRSFGGSPYSVLFAYRTACEPSCDAARARLVRFLHSVGAEIAVNQPQTTAAGRGRRTA
jgi:EpsI family protein